MKYLNKWIKRRDFLGFLKELYLCVIDIIMCLFFMLEKLGLYLFYIEIEIWLIKFSKNSILFVDIYMMLNVLMLYMNIIFINFRNYNNIMNFFISLLI